MVNIGERFLSDVTWTDVSALALSKLPDFKASAMASDSSALTL
jgi:hypothetical protein